jgi:hypothetical protein
MAVTIFVRWRDAHAVIEIMRPSDETDEQLSLDIHNVVWPTDRHTLDEERSYRASLRDFIDSS